MPNEVNQLVNYVTVEAGRFDRHQWIIISVVVLIIGLVTMRGFGSRNNY
jgi:hypothetical protein